MPTLPRIKHGTLVSNTVTDITLDADYNTVEVMNRGAAGTSDIYFRVDDVEPTVGGDDNYIVGPGGFLIVPVPGVAANTEVSLISSGTPPYSVTGLLS